MSDYKGNKNLLKSLKKQYNLDNDKKWNKYILRRGYGTLKYGYLEPLQIKNQVIEYTKFRNITSYSSELSTLLLKYILISERRLTFSMIDIFGHKSSNWSNYQNYDFSNKKKRKSIVKFVERTHSKVNFNNKRYENEMTKYNYVNLWTISKMFTFGNTKVFWNITNTEFKNKWNNKFGLKRRNTKNLEVIANFEQTIFSMLKNNLIKDYKTMNTIGIISQSINLLNDARNISAHNESILNEKYNIIELICVLNLFLSEKEINRMIKEIISLHERYLMNNDLYNSLSSKQKRMFSIDPWILKKYKQFVM